MTTVAIDGIIGWEVTAADIRASLDEAGGDDVDLLVSSPGGSVYEGLAIYNAIRDYRRAGGKVTARVVGLAASMATYIPLAAQTVTIEDNAIWMIHNPSMIALGDQRSMRKAADVLEGIANVIAAAYERKTGTERAELRAMMDDETYLYGEEIAEAGFADSMVPAGDGAEDRDEAVAIARAAVGRMEETLKKEADAEETEQIAAMLGGVTMQEAEPDNPAVSGTPEGNTPAREAGTREVPMTKELLSKEHPDLYNALSAELEEAGVQKERARVAKLRSYIDSDPDNVKLAEVINAAIASGEAAGDIDGRIQVAIRDGGKLDGENAPSVETANDPMEGLDKDDIEAMKLLDMSAAEYRKYKGGE
ncbi:MAG: head maturation protease, ClpP-related [Spirochaetota bacterium]